MAEHEHKIFHSGATEDPIVPVCSECGKDLMVLWQEAEQRVAEAQEELRIALAQRQDKQARLTEATALLQQFAGNDEEPLCIFDDCIDCNLCDTRLQGEALQRYFDVKKVFPHAPGCPWLQARAFLAR